MHIMGVFFVSLYFCCFFIFNDEKIFINLFQLINNSMSLYLDLINIFDLDRCNIKQI
jgi:hypothetical protein